MTDLIVEMPGVTTDNYYMHVWFQTKRGAENFILGKTSTSGYSNVVFTIFNKSTDKKVYEKSWKCTKTTLTTAIRLSWEYGHRAVTLDNASTPEPRPRGGREEREVDEYERTIQRMHEHAERAAFDLWNDDLLPF